MATDLGVTLVQERRQSSDITAQVGLAEGPSVDEAQNDDAVSAWTSSGDRPASNAAIDAARSRSRKT